MIRKILSFGSRQLAAENENGASPCVSAQEKVTASNVRALATGAALAVAVDNSPAVLVSIYDYAHRFRDHERRRIAC